MYHPVQEAPTAAFGNDSAAAYTAVSVGLAAGCRAVAWWDRGPSADPSWGDASLCIGVASRPRR